MTGQSKATNTFQSKKMGKNFVPPPIPFERPPRKELKKDQQLTVTLRSTPTDPSLQTYQMTIPFFRSGTPEEWLLVKKTLLKIIIGQNITQGPSKYSMARRVLEGDILARFDAKAAELGNENNANFNTCLDRVTAYVFPARALQVQRRFLRRHMRKKPDCTIREFNARLHELNSYLPDFPPGGANQQLHPDDLSEIIEFSMPNKWQSHMVLHNFVPSEHTLIEVVEFCERLKFIERLTPSNGHNDFQGKNSQTDPKGSKKRDHQRGGKSSDEAGSPGNSGKRHKSGKYCPLHDCDSHDMSECKVMLNQVKTMRDAFANRGQKTSGTPKKRDAQGTKCCH